MQCVLVALITVAAFTLGIGAGPAHAQAAMAPTEIEAQFIEAINALRVQQGVTPLTWDDSLATKARSWSMVMASEGGIRHSDLKDGIDVPWSRLGENVGMGGSVTSLHDAFVASPSHYENLVDPGFDAMAIGVTVAEDGTIYVAQEFMERPEAPVASSPEPSAGGTGVSFAIARPAAPVPASVEGAAEQAPDGSTLGSPPASAGRVREVIHPAATQLPVASRDLTAPLLLALLALMAVGSVLTLVRPSRRPS